MEERCANTPYELQQMLQELADKSKNRGLKMNNSKTKVIMENDTYVNTTQIEDVERYIYLGQRYSTRDKTKTRRFKEESRPDEQHLPKTATSSRVRFGTCLKRQVYNSCVLPAMTHGAETWALTSQAKNRQTAAQTTIERSVLNITYRDRKANI